MDLALLWETGWEGEADTLRGSTGGCCSPLLSSAEGQPLPVCAPWGQAEVLHHEHVVFWLLEEIAAVAGI